MITYRLKEILEDNIPELAGKVAIIESGKPVAKRGKHGCMTGQGKA